MALWAGDRVLTVGSYEVPEVADHGLRLRTLLLRSGCQGQRVEVVGVPTMAATAGRECGRRESAAPRTCSAIMAPLHWIELEKHEIAKGMRCVWNR